MMQNEERNAMEIDGHFTQAETASEAGSGNYRSDEEDEYDSKEGSDGEYDASSEPLLPIYATMPLYPNKIRRHKLAGCLEEDDEDNTSQQDESGENGREAEMLALTNDSVHGMEYDIQ
jgi:hypothetical protein